MTFCKQNVKLAHNKQIHVIYIFIYETDNIYNYYIYIYDIYNILLYT